MISKVGFVVFYSSCVGAMQTWDTVVSLDYQVKYHLKRVGIAAQDSPFDCIDASVEGVIKMLGEHFEGFLEREMIRLPHDESVLDVRYDATLVGPLIDIPFIIDIADVKGWLKEEDPDSTGFAKIKAIHDERVQQLLTLLQSEKRVLFMRKDITKRQALRLDELLQKLYPRLAYTIVALGEDGSYIDDWGLSRIRSFNMGPLQEGLCCGHEAAWKKVFDAFGLRALSDEKCM